MVVTYTTADNVSALLGVGAYGTTTIPTITQVEAIINRMEEFIDLKTGHGWRERTSNVEVYDICLEDKNKEDYDWKVILLNRKVKTFNSDTDTLLVWDGTDWINFLTTKTENRATGDYWVDYDQGIIYLKNNYEGSTRVKVQYRFGETSVPKDIEDACTKLVAADVLTLDNRTTNAIPEGNFGQNGIQQTISKFQRDARNIMNSRAEFKGIFV